MHTCIYTHCAANKIERFSWVSSISNSKQFEKRRMVYPILTFSVLPPHLFFLHTFLFTWLRPSDFDSGYPESARPPGGVRGPSSLLQPLGFPLHKPAHSKWTVSGMGLSPPLGWGWGLSRLPLCPQHLPAQEPGIQEGSWERGLAILERGRKRGTESLVPSGQRGMGTSWVLAWQGSCSLGDLRLALECLFQPF